MSYSIIEKRQSYRKRAYVPDLDGLLSQCELNYWLMVRLFPELPELFDLVGSAGVDIHRWYCQADSVKLSFEVSEIARYTTTLKLTVQTSKIEIARSGQLILRLYHDAQMAEVMEGTGPSALRAIYERAADGKTVDEKRQANLFIGECLRACFRQAQSQATNSPI